MSVSHDSRRMFIYIERKYYYYYYYYYCHFCFGRILCYKFKLPISQKITSTGVFFLNVESV